MRDALRFAVAARLGTASSLVETMQWSIACVASFLLRMLYNGTCATMKERILVSDLSGFLIFKLGSRSRSPRSPPKPENRPSFRANEENSVVARAVRESQPERRLLCEATHTTCVPSVRRLELESRRSWPKE